jgi:choline kinase
MPAAVILAAGEGSRLRSGPEALPKPLTLLAGDTLLDRAVASCVVAGVTEIVVVVGFRREVLKPAVEALSARYDVSIRAAVSQRWRLGNGASVLASEPYLDGPFFLMMCDHVFDPRFLERLLDADDGRRPVAVVVDRDIELVPDLNEATKTRIEGLRVTAIGKHLTAFDAVDTGVFLCRPQLYDALHEAAARGGHTLSDAVQLLARRGQAGWVDSDGLPWIDVDTVGDLLLAEALLANPMERAAEVAGTEPFVGAAGD